MNGLDLNHRIKHHPKQQGFLVVALIVLIVIVGFVGAVLTYMFSNSGRSSGRNTQSNQALSLAEAGLNKAALQFNNTLIYPCPTTVTVSNPSCSLSLSNWSGSENLGRGQFQYRSFMYTGPAWGSYAPPAPVTTTLAPITPVANSTTTQTVPVSSVSNFAPIGQIMVGTNPVNYLNYSGVATSPTICGAGFNACFVGVLYQGNTTLSAGQTVSQNQTVLTQELKKSSSLQIVNVASVNNLAPFGVVIIGDQFVPYAGWSTVPATCGGSPPCLFGASYTEGPNLAVNSRVSQNQLVFQGRGEVPSLAAPQGDRTVMAAFLQSLRCIGTNPGQGSGNNGNGCGINGNGTGTGGIGFNPGNGSDNQGNQPAYLTVTFILSKWSEVVN